MCGIFAIHSNNNNNKNIRKLVNGMKSLQHRGKDGFGVSGILNNGEIKTIKLKGKIKNNENIDNLKVSSCIGHIRYTTSGISLNNSEIKINEIQPLIGNISEIGEYSLVHNGNIPNIKGHDTTYLNNLLMSLNNLGNIENRLIHILENIPAAYSIVILINNIIYAMRDRYGIRPLCLGKDDNNYYISSESCAFNEDIDYSRDIQSGELLKIDKTGIKTIYKYKNSIKGICAFEILYFANEKSFIDGLYIKNIRRKLSKILALTDTNTFSSKKDYTVIGIPLTGILLGKSYAKMLNLNYEQLITKNKNVLRTFIAITNEDRQRLCNKKFIYDKDKLKGKNIIIVDDTIVRGNVIKSIIKNLKKCGVKEIHIRIPAPPVIDICELGICIQSKKELIMNNKTIDNVKEEICSDSLKYLTLENLMKNIPKNSYNQCFSGYIDPIIKSYNKCISV